MSSIDAEASAAPVEVLQFAGDGAVAVDVEAMCVDLRDVARPHRAQAAARPQHGD